MFSSRAGVSGVLAAACYFALSGPTFAEDGEITSTQIVASGLVHPWGMDFFSNGDAIISEMVGRIRIFRRNWSTQLYVAGLPAVRNLFDVAVHPDFERTSWIFFSYSFEQQDGTYFQVMRGRLSGISLENLTTILEVGPAATPPFSGGRLLFLDPHTLLASVGDKADGKSGAQDAQQLFGKTVAISMHAEGKFNQASSDAVKSIRIFSLGHRNVQGLAQDTSTGTIWASEHGPAGGDEINILEEHGNHGWPLSSHGRHNIELPLKSSFVDFLQPRFIWVDAVAPSGIAIRSSDKANPSRNEIIVSTLRGTSIRRLRLNADGRGIESESVLKMATRMRDVAVSPDGEVYALTDSPQGEVVKVLLE